MMIMIFIILIAIIINGNVNGGPPYNQHHYYLIFQIRLTVHLIILYIIPVEAAWGQDVKASLT